MLHEIINSFYKSNKFKTHELKIKKSLKSKIFLHHYHQASSHNIYLH